MVRSPFYSLAITLLLALNSEWPVVLAQSAVVAATILFVLRATTGRLDTVQYICVMGALALLTGLPWHSSLIMTDVFTALVPLGLFLLVFARDRFARWELGIIFAITCFASLAHYSHLPLAAALSAVALGILLLERRPMGEVFRAAACCLAIVTITIVAHVAAQWTIHGRLALSPSGPVFLLARLAEDGPLKDYLVSHCPQANLKLCAFADDLPMKFDDFLWAQDGPVGRSGGIEALRSEASIVVPAAIGEEPFRFVRLSIDHTLLQLTLFGMEDYVRSYQPSYDEWKKTISVMNDSLAAEVPALDRSREATGQIHLHRLFRLQTLVVTVSGVLLLALYLLGCLRADRRLRELLWLAVAAVVVNAAVCSTISEPGDRFQSRVVWLLPFLLMLVALSIFNARRPPRGPVSATADG